VPVGIHPTELLENSLLELRHAGIARSGSYLRLGTGYRRRLARQQNYIALYIVLRMPAPAGPEML
jgi:hypothetical protein